MNPVDLRSDTVTVPGPKMRQAMANAEVGDDVFGEDPTVRALEELGASLVGQEAALFVPSGTMANQIAIATHCRRGDDVLVGEGAHSYLYESAAGAVISGVQFTVVGRGGHFSASELAAAVHVADAYGHVAPTRLAMVENTHNRGGGIVMRPEVFAEISTACGAANVALHMDGARLFNAAAACDLPAEAWGRAADSVSICLSKGLGAPIGSLLCGSADFISAAHRWRKMLGGGMRQVGIIAAGGLYALKNQIPDLAEDNRRAQVLAKGLAELPGLTVDLASVETNIVFLRTAEPIAHNLVELVSETARVLAFDDHTIRAVTHRDVDDAGIERTLRAFCDAL